MTTPAKQQARYEAAIKEHLADRAKLLLGTDQQIIALLRQALAQIQGQLAQQPADWQQWQLSRLRDQIEVILTATGQQAGVAVGQALRSSWQQGEDMVDKPMTVVGHNIELRLAALDARVLAAMQTFGVDRMANVTAEAAGKITQQLGMVTIGGITPFQAVKAVQKILESDSIQRATRIVNTEVSRAFAVAADARLVQAAPLVPGLGKQWRRSGKIHSRWNHDLMDGQVVEAGKAFKVPNPGGGFDMMQCPHDPKAPIEQVIHCGCISLPWLKGWKVMTPGAKPFTERELQLDRGKAMLDQAAKRAGRRQE